MEALGNLLHGLRLNEYKHGITLQQAKEQEIKSITPCEYRERICQYCGQIVWPTGVLNPFENSIFIWYPPSEFCDCKKGEEDKEKYNKEQENLHKEKVLQLENRRKQKKIDELFKNSRMGERFRNRVFENFEVKECNKKAYNMALKYAENFKDNKDGTGIVFSGSVGTGKTHLAAAITNELLKQYIPVVFGSLVSLLGRIKDSYNGSGDEQSILELYSTVDLLVIDDLGKERPTEWTLEKLYLIINDRYEAYKPVIVTTNFNNRTLIERLSGNNNSSTAEAIVSRIFETCPGVMVNGPDYRMR